MLPDYVLQFVHKIADKEGFLPQAYIIEEQPPQQHKHFTAGILRLNVRGGRSVERFTSGHQLDLVCVTPATAELYEREVCALRDILPTMSKFHDDHNHTKFSQKPATFVEWPQFFGTLHQTDRPDAFVVEDVVDADFGLSRESELLDPELTKSALAEMAKLHAISFAMRQKRPEALQELRERMPHGAMPVLLQKAEDPACRQQWLDEFNAAIGTLNDDETGLAEEMEALRDSYAERLRKCLIVESEGDLDTAVVSHGDFWLPNIGFLMSKNGEIPSVCLTGWNSMQFTIPVVDVLHFLFTSVPPTFLMMMFWDFIEVYHKVLSSSLLSLGCEPMELYPMDKLREQIHKYAQYGLLVAPRMLAKMSKTDEKSYKDQMRNVIRNFVTLGFEV